MIWAKKEILWVWMCASKNYSRDPHKLSEDRNNIYGFNPRYLRLGTIFYFRNDMNEQSNLVSVNVCQQKLLKGSTQPLWGQEWDMGSNLDTFGLMLGMIWTSKAILECECCSYFGWFARNCYATIASLKWNETQRLGSLMQTKLLVKSARRESCN